MVLRFFLLAITFLFISCSDLERDNPEDEYSKNYVPPRSSSSSSSSAPYVPPVISSSSSVVSSSSSLPSYDYCIMSNNTCLVGPFNVSTCSGQLSNNCPYSSSSFYVLSSSSSTPYVPPVVPSSSSSVPSSSSLPIQSVVTYGPSITYQGEAYQTVVIGTQTWFKRNLNYAAEGSKCYGDNTGDDSQNRCDTYGRLYNWATANTVCPGGWHLPSNAEWTTLTDYVGGASAGTKLKSSSGWNSYSGVPAGTDNYGFSALPGGGGNSDGYFFNVGGNGYWWSSSEGDSSIAYNRRMDYSVEDAYWHDEIKDFLFSVRCLQD